MTVVLVEGFDHLAAAAVPTKGWSAAPAGMTSGRFDGQSAGVTNTSTGKILPSTYSTLIVGVAMNTPSIPTSTNDFLRLMVGATATCRLGLTSAGLLVVRNSGGTTIATGTTPIVAGNWNYFEIKLVVGTSGTVEVHLNGVTEISSTTGNFGTSNIDTVNLIGFNFSSTQVDFDDLYALDTTGSAPQNTFLGDVRVETIYPTGAGSHTQWTPNGAASNWDCVDETTPDGDTTYVSDSTPGHIDTYAFGDIDTGATVYAVQKNIYARKDDASTRQIAAVTRQSGTDYVGTTKTLSSSYSTYSQLDNQDPTGSNWTPTTVNADEFGVKEIA